ncbi:lytic transglycosylase domain-containing protein [Roseovarius azorensis]|uniref:lytic transglycosylase domain-containing protein n=1 Tax=Roseovarius azorensis TaxID=1287727 RepID=UPI003CCBCCEB
MKVFIFLVSTVILLGSGPALAGDPPPFPEFTFKREKPPAPDTRKRITVQIEAKAPPAPAKTPKAPEEPLPDGARISGYDWFWQRVPADLASSSADRLRSAMDHLANPPAGQVVGAPRLQTLQQIARSEGRHILRETIGTPVSPALVLAMIAIESSGRSDALSPAGAQGLMQLMPGTAKRFGVRDVLAPDQNIRGGVAYLNWLIEEFGGDVVLALAGYNAGENAVRRHNGVPPYAETRDYIPKVLAAFEVARGLCKTRPELITDACALNLAMK